MADPLINDIDSLNLEECNDENNGKIAVDTAQVASISGFTDKFTENLQAGKVVGSQVCEDVSRKGVDKEGVIGIDNGALRIRPLIKTGWGRAGVAYGPYPRRNGLAFGAFLLNGHNTSQAEPLPDDLLQRFRRWALGTETEGPLTRVYRWLRTRHQKKHTWRLMLQWIRSGGRLFRVHPLDENLAVGWFPREAPSNPVQEGNSLIMHALGPECGGLWARVRSAGLRAISGVQNVPLYYLVILRKRGAAYYCAGVPGVPDLPPYPNFRPLAIDAFATDDIVFAGIHQSVLGQIGFRAESRVFRTQVGQLAEFGDWCGSAHGADTLTGSGSLESFLPIKGGRWSTWQGEFLRTQDGLMGVEPDNCAVLKLKEPVGLLHVLVKTGCAPVRGVTLLWRVQDRGNFWGFQVSSEKCRLLRLEAGTECAMPAIDQVSLLPNSVNSLQVTDDGENIRLYVNGEIVYGSALRSDRTAGGCAVGFRVLGDSGSVVLRDLEAHPRTIELPRELDLGQVSISDRARVVIRDDFGSETGDLDGREVTLGGTTWHKEIGSGVIELTGSHSARVIGTVKSPSPGRLAYTLPWSCQNYADLHVNITPPGTERWKGERGRGGLIFWQDRETYITFSAFVDDWYGTSIAAFFRVDGFEELYDAVWSNLGKRVYWGVPYRFRVTFENERFMAYVNDEPVLYRALSDIYPDWHDFHINRVGIVSNWEWGTDTGTIFEDFEAREPA